MSKARKVEVSSTITVKEYNKLRQHAVNTAFWWITNYNKNSSQLREKLYDKGYPKEATLVVASDGKKVKRNIVEGVISHLETVGTLDDRELAATLASRKLAQGLGLSKIRIDLLRASFPKELVEDVLCELEEHNEQELQEALEKTYEAALRKNIIAKEEDPYKKRQKLQQVLMRKGFNWSDIRTLMANQEE